MIKAKTKIKNLIIKLRKVFKLMKKSEENFTHLRSRKVARLEPKSTATKSQQRTSTPNPSPPRSLANLRESVRDTTQFLKEISNDIDENLSLIFPNLTGPIQNTSQFFKELSNHPDKNLSNLFPNTSRSCTSPIRMADQGAFYNKELADLMANNIPKFQLNSGNNPALELRSFIKSCENVLSLFDSEDNDTKEEFFKLIKFRLGYDVQERLTVDKFEDIQSLENHLRSVCHLKLNKGKLLSEIRHERQYHNEDVSHFVERLRKLIAQGRSEYPNDKEFEREAIHTLKNSVKNEFISIKLMDSTTNKFEELAEIAINRDSDLHQRAYKTTKTNESASQDLINQLMEKIKTLEAKQKEIATVQHIRNDPRFITKPQYRANIPHRSPNRNTIFCNYCKRIGHHINDCRTKNRNLFNSNSNQYRNNRNENYGNYRRNHNANNNRMGNYNRNYDQEINSRQQNYEKNSPDYRMSRNPFTDMKRSPGNIDQYSSTPQQGHNMSSSLNCLRCNKPGHKSNNCYEIICRNCKQIGHTQNQCPQDSTTRRVHCLQCTHENETYPDQGN